MRILPPQTYGGGADVDVIHGMTPVPAIEIKRQLVNTGAQPLHAQPGG